MYNNSKKDTEAENYFEFIKKSFELKNNKMYKEAIEMLYNALACNYSEETDVEIVYQIGDLYYLLKDYQAAIERYEKVLEINHYHEQSLLGLFDIYCLLNEKEKALFVIATLCKNSKNVEHFRKYFKILHETGKANKIKEIYKNIDDTMSLDEEILYIVSLNDKDEKEGLLKKIYEKNPDNVNANFDLGIIAFQKDDFENAQKYFETVISYEKKAEAYNYLGLIYQRNYNFSKAIECFYNAVKLEDNNPEYFFNLAKGYIDVHWFKEAQIAVLKALKLLSSKGNKVDLGKYYYTLGWLNWQEKNYKNAIINLSLVDKTSAFRENAEVLSGIIDLNLGEKAKAKVKLEKLYNSKDEIKNNPDLISALGKIYREFKMYDKAEDIYEKALVNYPSSFEYTSELIDTLIDDKKYDKAFLYADKFLEMYPQAICVYNSYARIYYRQKKYEEALLELKKLIATDKNNPEAYYFSGLILNDLKKPEDAIENIKTAIHLNPTQAKYYAQIARSYSLLRRFEDAVLYIKEALDIMPEEINYLKKASEYCKNLGNQSKSEFYTRQANILEKFLKFNKLEK